MAGMSTAKPSSPNKVRDTFTPVRRQYMRIKQRYPDALLLFRMGDFYETFDEDAHTASQALDIALTSRSMGKGSPVPLAGVPAHSLEPYLARLIKAGYKVAICEQLSDPAASKGIVDRDVVRVVTPGTVVEPSLLEQKANNYLVALLPDGAQVGLAYVDITTGEFCATQLPVAELGLELSRLDPAEALAPEGTELERTAGCTLTPLPTYVFREETAARTLMDHFGVASLEAYGCVGLPLAVGAAGAILDYLSQTQKGALKELRTLNVYSTASYMTLDIQTRRNLELFQGGRWGNSEASLYNTLDLTRTPMGGRLLRRWMGQPLRELEPLVRRQDSVGWFHNNMLERERASSLLSRIGDLERTVGRVRLGTAVPRELLGLANGLTASLELVDGLSGVGELAWLLAGFESVRKPCEEAVELIGRAVKDDPVGEPGDGGVFQEGFSPELDELRQASGNAREYIAGLERKEREATGIKNLKVGYNRVFGYYIEVTNANLAMAPDTYTRRQTLVGGERFITPELKEYESRILGARERIEELEKALYRQVCAQIGEQSWAVSALGEAVAHLDVFHSLGEAAVRYGYVRPTLNEGAGISIKGGRHPVVERTLPPGSFVGNDTDTSSEDSQVMIITGPNMAGKSTYIRQAALIVLMAQMGSFVPADSASIGLVDRIFTRLGLQDDLSTGQSTFMVEMVETAVILNQATSRSLVILDEIGRGTSTYDGLSIAKAVVEHLHNHPRLGCKTLFATHYHELTELAETLPRVKNYSVAVSEEDGQVVFLHRIEPGRADKSYGIHVARLAGMPQSVVNRAWEELDDLERQNQGNARGQAANAGFQMALFGGEAPNQAVLDELLEMDVSTMTPLTAINVLYRLQRQAQGISNLEDEG